MTVVVAVVVALRVAVVDFEVETVEDSDVDSVADTDVVAEELAVEDALSDADDVTVEDAEVIALGDNVEQVVTAVDVNVELVDDDCVEETVVT